MKTKNFYWLISGITLLGVLALAALGGVSWWLSQRSADKPFAVTIDPPKPLEDFTLTTGDGERHALNEYRGKVILLFFGYTHCPDICPLTLTNIQSAMQKLGPAANDVQVIMITVDPERDTPAHMAEFVHAFNPRFLGLSGTPQEIADIAKTYGIYYAQGEPDADGNYLVEHYVGVLTFDKQGYLRMIFPFGVTGDQFAQALQPLLH